MRCYIFRSYGLRSLGSSHTHHRGGIPTNPGVQVSLRRVARPRSASPTLSRHHRHSLQPPPSPVFSSLAPATTMLFASALALATTPAIAPTPTSSQPSPQPLATLHFSALISSRSPPPLPQPLPQAFHIIPRPNPCLSSDVAPSLASTSRLAPLLSPRLSPSPQHPLQPSLLNSALHLASALASHPSSWAGPGLRPPSNPRLTPRTAFHCIPHKHRRT